MSRGVAACVGGGGMTTKNQNSKRPKTHKRKTVWFDLAVLGSHLDESLGVLQRFGRRRNPLLDCFKLPEHKYRVLWVCHNAGEKVSEAGSLHGHGGGSDRRGFDRSSEPVRRLRLWPVFPFLQ